MKVTLKLVIVASAALAAAAAMAQGAKNKERTGEQIVTGQCAQCHRTGEKGAPKIDDRAAWAARMKTGLDATVRSAIKGHGGMPARGGLADLSDTELRAAILYMFYPAGATAKLQPYTPPAPADPHRKVVEGMELNLGIVPAESMAARTSAKPPSGKGVYHVNIGLRDAKTGAEIKGAQVEARVANAVTGGETKKLQVVKTGDTVTYGNYFRMSGKEPYTITVKVDKPQAAEARFEFKP